MFANLFRARRSQKARRRQSGPKSLRLALEPLEARWAPAFVDWILNADGDFNNPDNWTVRGTNPPIHRVPNEGDYAVINAPSAITVTYAAGTQTIQGINSANRLRMTGGSLAIEDTVPRESVIRMLDLRTGAQLRVLNDIMTLVDQGTIAGHLEVAFGARLNFGNCGAGGNVYNVNTGAEFSGDGAYVIQACTAVHVNQSMHFPDNFAVSGSGSGTLYINGTADVIAGRTFTLNSINYPGLLGSGTLTVPKGSTVHWFGGSMESTGTTRIEQGATLNLLGPDGKGLYQTRRLINSGTVNWTDPGGLELSPGTVFDNYGSFNDLDAHNMHHGAGTFVNAGSYTKDSPFSQTTFTSGYVFSNNGGYVGVYGGTLDFAGAYVQNAGGFTEVAPGATLAAASVTVEEGGFLWGSGTVRANVTNRGTVSPGGDAAAGTLTIAGNYTQAGTGTLNIELGDAASDQLDVQGTATLDGTLNVLLLDDFFAELDANYRVLEARTCNGTFAWLNLPDISPLTWNPRYDATGLTLSIV